MNNPLPILTPNLRSIHILNHIIGKKLDHIKIVLAPKNKVRFTILTLEIHAPVGQFKKSVFTSLNIVLQLIFTHKDKMIYRYLFFPKIQGK